MEDREQLKESGRRFDRGMEELRESQRKISLEMQETDRRMQETDRRMKETDRQIGELSNRFGELAEHLVAPSINEKFNELGFNFEEVSHSKTIRDSSGQFLAEIDILLENGEIVIAVEVKSKPNQKDVRKHIERMEVLRSRANKRNDTRKFQGAIAGAIMGDEVRLYAQSCGFYTIEQSGDTVKISIPEAFTPREW